MVHLVVFRELLEDIGEALVLQLTGYFEAPFVAHLLQSLCEVGGLEVFVRGNELRGRLGLVVGAGLGVGPSQ
jgi:hypothetical protein